MALGTPVAAAAAYGGTTSVTPAYPSGILATDVVLLFVGQKPSTANGGTVTTPSGWTLREQLLAAGGYGTTLGADTGNTNLRVYSWDNPVAGQTGNLTVTLGTNNVTWAFMVRIPKGAGAAEFGSADGQRTTTPTSPMSIALTNGASATDFQAGDRAIWAMCIPTDVTTPSQFSAQSITATGATFGTATELNEPDSQTGNDIGGYSAWAAVTAGSSTTAPTVTVTLAGTLTNVRGPVALLRVREGAAAQTLTPSLFTNTNTFHNPTVTPGAVNLSPSLYTNGQTFYSPDVTQSASSQTLAPNLYTNAQIFYAATVTSSNSLAPGLYTNAQTFFAPTVASGATLAPGLYTNTQTFYIPTVSATATVAPDLYSNAQTFYSATVSASNALTPALYTNDQTFYGAVISQTGGAQTLLPSLYTNNNTFFSPSISVGAVNLSPSLYTNNQQFFSATLGSANQLEPQLVTNVQEFYAPTIGVAVEPELLVNAQQFFAATAQSTYSLQPQPYVEPGYVDPGYVGPNTYSTQQFFSPTVSEKDIVVPPLLVNTNSFYSPSIQLESFVITRAQALSLYDVYVLQGLANPLVVGPTSRTSGAVQQTISEAGGQVTISTTSANTVFNGDVGTLIAELAALHGLTSNLVVTGSSRSSGAITQSIVTAGGITTVTRQ